MMKIIQKKQLVVNFSTTPSLIFYLDFLMELHGMTPLFVFSGEPPSKALDQLHWPSLPQEILLGQQHWKRGKKKAKGMSNIWKGQQT